MLLNFKKNLRKLQKIKDSIKKVEENIEKNFHERQLKEYFIESCETFKKIKQINKELNSPKMICFCANTNFVKLKERSKKLEEMLERTSNKLYKKIENIEGRNNNIK